MPRELRSSIFVIYVAPEIWNVQGMLINSSWMTICNLQNICFDLSIYPLKRLPQVPHVCQQDRERWLSILHHNSSESPNFSLSSWHFGSYSGNQAIHKKKKNFVVRLPTMTSLKSCKSLIFVHWVHFGSYWCINAL